MAYNYEDNPHAMANDPHWEMGDPYDQVEDSYGERETPEYEIADTYIEPHGFSDGNGDDQGKADHACHCISCSYRSWDRQSIQPLLPCCSGRRPSNLPTSWTIEDMLQLARNLRKPNYPTHGNRRQRRALRRLRKMIEKADQKVPVRSEKKLRKLFSCLDESVFQGRMKSRTRLVFHTHGHRDLLGFTGPSSHCRRHRHIYGVEIHVLTDRPFQKVLETMLHEMCHGFSFLFLDPNKLSCFDFIVYAGDKGHGLLFQKLFRSCVCFLQHNVGNVLRIDVGQHLSHVSASSRKLRQDVRNVFEGTLAQLQTHRSLRRALKLDQKYGAWLHNRIQEGRDILEIIMLTYFRKYISGHQWRYPIARQGISESIVVEGLDDETSKFLLKYL